MWTSALFVQKTSNFKLFKIYGVFARTRERVAIEPVRTFCGQGGRSQFFAILCFYGRPHYY